MKIYELSFILDDYYIGFRKIEAESFMDAKTKLRSMGIKGKLSSIKLDNIHEGGSS